MTFYLSRRRISRKYREPFACLAFCRSEAWTPRSSTSKPLVSSPYRFKTGRLNWCRVWGHMQIDPFNLEDHSISFDSCCRPCFEKCQSSYCNQSTPCASCSHVYWLGSFGSWGIGIHTDFPAALCTEGLSTAIVEIFWSTVDALVFPIT